MNKLKFLYSIIRYGDWAIGFETRKTWKTKNYWSFGREYYDRYHYYLHIGWFYACVSY